MTYYNPYSEFAKLLIMYQSGDKNEQAIMQHVHKILNFIDWYQEIEASFNIRHVQTLI